MYSEIEEKELRALEKERQAQYEKLVHSEAWKLEKVVIHFRLWCDCEAREFGLKSFVEYLKDGGEFKNEDRFLCRYERGYANCYVESNYKKVKALIEARVNNE